MARKRSKAASAKSEIKSGRQKSKRRGLWSRIKELFSKIKKRFERPDKVNPHKTFKRSYREDYRRDTNVPGIMYHIFETFKIIFKNWKLFLPLLIIVSLLDILLVGLMSEATYVQFQKILDETSESITGGNIGNVARAGLLLMSTVTTGGLSGESGEAATLFGIIIFLVVWLTTIYLLRHRMAGHSIKLRDGLYNAMAPLLSTMMVVIIVLFQCIPIFVLTIAFSAAVQTEFLATPFYALVFFVFAAVMILTSGYLLSSSLMALVAVTAPGLYPIRALNTASDLMMGRRIKMILRLIALIVALAIVWVIVMLPLILFDLFMKQFEWTTGIPFVPVCLVLMTCFTEIYITAFLYLYYRWMLKA